MRNGLCLQDRDGVFRDLAVVMEDPTTGHRRMAVCVRCGTEFQWRRTGQRKRCPLCEEPAQMVVSR